jgi:copper(I)-binding protein
MRRYLALIALAIAAMPPLAQAGTPPPLAVTDGELRLPPPGVTVMAGYMTLRNDSETPVTVVGVEITGAQSAMMHETRTVQDRTTMEPLMDLTIAPHGTVAFAPGGKHLMVRFATAPAAGQAIGLTLRLKDGRTATGALRTVAKRP